MDDGAEPFATAQEWLGATLPWLGARIAALIEAGDGFAAEPYLGAFLSRENALALAATVVADGPSGRQPAAQPSAAATASGAIAGLPVGRMVDAFGLPPGLGDLVALILAPEVDARFGRLFAFLNDDAGRRLPTSALAQQILGPLPRSPTALFSETAPLVAFHLVEPLPQGTALIDRPLRFTDRMVRFLLGETDGRGRRPCRLDTGGRDPGKEKNGAATCLTPDEAADDEPALAGLTRTVAAVPLDALVPDGDALHALRRASLSTEPLVLTGVAGCGRSEIAAALLRERHRAALCLDGAPVAAAPALDAQRIIRLAVREAALAGGGLILANAEKLPRSILMAGVAGAPCRVLLTAPSRLDVDWPHHAIAPLEGERLRTVWAAVVGSGHVGLAAQLSERFRLPVREIVGAVRGADRDLATIAAACRERSDRTLDELAVRVPTRHDWDDLVLPQRQLARLKAMVRRVENAAKVFDDWGFGRKLSPYRGFCALFPGPSGTGKTLSAGIVARALNLALYKVDLSATVSKYIGETEKNLERVFAAAEAANAVLFFDEADALFGKRSEVKDAHDRYANIETSYLLQRMERHRGIVILGTNLAQNIDEAFTRRIDVIVEFSQPDVLARTRLWQILVPPEAALDPAADLGGLGARFELSGGEIRNCLLVAAFLAADEGVPITTAHCLQAVATEYEKTGRPLTRTQFGDAFAGVRPRRGG